jgi:hypothetical protein
LAANFADPSAYFVLYVRVTAGNHFTMSTLYVQLKEQVAAFTVIVLSFGEL